MLLKDLVTRKTINNTHITTMKKTYLVPEVDVTLVAMERAILSNYSGSSSENLNIVDENADWTIN